MNAEFKVSTNVKFEVKILSFTC